MIRIEFNHAPATEAIKRAVAALENPQPMHDEIGEYMIQATRQRFLKGVAPDGTAWARKSEGTLARYKRMGYGSLSRPLIGPGRALSRQIKKFVSRDGVVIGSALIYSGVMQHGARKGAFGSTKGGLPIPFGDIPARPWLGVSDEDGRKIVAIADEYLAQQLGQPGGG